MSPRPKDNSKYINTKHGHLTILMIDKCKATCLCDCGNKTKNTVLKRILDGKTTMCKSCSGKINGAKGNIPATKRTEQYIGKIFNYFTIIAKATTEESGKPGQYKCQCVCGNIVYHDLHSLKNQNGKGAKSCGCKQSYLLSIAGGGTGIANEHTPINTFIRKGTKEYDIWVTTCLQKADYTCFVSGEKGKRLNVHHLIPLSVLIKTNNITIDNYKEYSSILFNINNGIVLSEDIHKELHSCYGLDLTLEHIVDYKQYYSLYPTAFRDDEEDQK